MERILNDNEKIRRAEEIYYRRNHARESFYQEKNKEKRKIKTYFGSKIILEMLILILTAIIIFSVKNKDYIFTQEFLNNLSQYNINLNDKINGILDYFKEKENNNDVFITKNEVTNNTVNEENTQVENIQEENNESQTQIIEVQGEENQSKSAESIITDSISLKNSFTFTKPIDGIITSRFGMRNSENKNVKGNHTGVDIASNMGTEIKSAIDGTVVQVSSDGDYGNHVKVEKNNVTVLYAHCKDIYVAEGDQVTEGQIIASVGSTGNSTGPHLHFEIRINNNPVDPLDIIDL